MSETWTNELWRLLVLAAVAIVVGLIFGALGWSLAVAAIAYLAWHLRNLYKLERWLRDLKGFQPPDGEGIWGEVFHQIYQLQKHHRNRKKMLASIINRFRESTTAMPQAMVVLYGNNEIEWFNKAATQLLGLNSPGDVGQRIDNLVRLPEFVAYLNNHNYDDALKIHAPDDDQRVLSINVVPYGETQRLLTAQDITQMQRLEQIRKDFVANVSHELKTPLTVLSGFLETLSDKGKEGDPQQRVLGLMREQTRRMQHIVTDLLLLSQLEVQRKRPKTESLPIPSLINDIYSEARSLSGDLAHRFTLEVDEHLWLRGNQEEMYSVISNLIFNAVQYTPAHKGITIRWYNSEVGAVFEVEDEGIGVPKQHIPRLTERFYRVDTGRSREKGGTGLGLAIVKHVLQCMEAKLQVDSELNHGSRFRCTFPPHLVMQHKEASALS